MKNQNFLIGLGYNFNPYLNLPKFEQEIKEYELKAMLEFTFRDILNQLAKIGKSNPEENRIQMEAMWTWILFEKIRTAPASFPIDNALLRKGDQKSIEALKKNPHSISPGIERELLRSVPKRFRDDLVMLCMLCGTCTAQYGKLQENYNFWGDKEIVSALEALMNKNHYKNKKVA